MSSDLDSVATELSALRAEADLSPELAKGRVYARLANTMSELAGASASAGAAARTQWVPGRSHRALRQIPGKAWLVGTFALGGAVGAGTYAALDREPEARVVYVDRIVAPTPKAVQAQAASAPPASSSAVEAARAVTGVLQKPLRGARVSSSAERPRERASAGAAIRASDAATTLPDLASLGEQQALLDRARLALTKENPAAALEMVDLHRQRFRESVLGEEREALAIKALAAIGKIAEARARFELFRERFSRSPLLPSLEAATKPVVTEANP